MAGTWVREHSVDGDVSYVLYRPIPEGIEAERFTQYQMKTFVAARLSKGTRSRRWRYSIRPHPNYDGGYAYARSKTLRAAQREAAEACEAAEAQLRLGVKFPKWEI